MVNIECNENKLVSPTIHMQNWKNIAFFIAAADY